ncbi:AraC family transcriptional regulator [Halalkalibacter urbisdiaboli]|uniref:AraC family transcriptional regulator n=1 Tax=Halalkalibacter urbisdiaboli TaxID=1960589 RepID=UPI000B44F123|nr:AraC family transcriptional regulator [Halalkalibacter urbisdiaboli]
MKTLFEHIPFDFMPFHLVYRRVSVNDFQGYYHWHQGCELLFVHSGQGRVIVNQQTYDIKRGMLFFFQPFQLHKVHVEVSQHTPYKRSILHFDPLSHSKNLHLFPTLNTLFDRLQKGILNQQAFDLENDYHYVSEIYKALNHSIIRNDWQEDSQLFLMQMLSCIRKNIDHVDNDNSFYHLRPFHYSEMIMQWIEEHYMEPFDLERLSDELHLSKSYVSRVFKRETGSSLTEYLIVRRMKQACQLLQTTNAPIEIIAENIGLFNVSYFIQLFKKVIGTTPHQYRLSQREI